MANEPNPDIIQFEYNGISVSIEGGERSLYDFYRSNPGRVENILARHLVAAVGDIYSGASLDPLFFKIDSAAQEQKRSLIIRLMGEEKNRN